MTAQDPTSRAQLPAMFTQLAPALHAWACVRLGPDLRARLTPEDLTQEIWLRAIEVFDSFGRSGGSFRAWLFAVAKNVLLEVRRKAMRNSRERGNDGSTSRLGALDQVPIEITSITRRVAKDEDLRRLVSWIDGLEEIEQQTVVLCGLEGVIPREASTRLGESCDATTKRWQRLRARMQAWGEPLGLAEQ